MAYSYGVPDRYIWIAHIVIGLIITYVGYAQLNHYDISQILAILLIILGVLAMLYHGHLLYLSRAQ
jgi:hypothetical protein